MQTFEGKVLKYIYESNMIQRGERILIAVSGGMDSMALLHMLNKYSHHLGIEVVVAHVDHMLRGEQSAGDRQFVEDFCHERNIPVFSKAIPIPTILEEEAGNLQAVCRRERYHFFEELMLNNEFSKLVTAHHADDQLESVLMALTKGAIMKGIQGIKPMRSFTASSFIIRPLLAVTKREIGQYLDEQGISYREDASNDKDDYMRNRIRHYVLPFLNDENPAVANHAVHFAQHLQEDADYLMQEAEKLFPAVVHKMSEQMFRMKIDAFQSVPLALQKRIILILLNYLYKNSNTVQSYALGTSLLKLCGTTEGNAEIHLPEGYKAVRAYHQLTIFNTENDVESIVLSEVPLGQWHDVGNDTRLYINPCTKVLDLSFNGYIMYYFNSQELTLPLYVRARQEGDRIALRGMNESKRISRLLIDEKVPLHVRDGIPVLASADNEVVALIGVRMSKYFSKEKRQNDDMMLIFSGASL